MMSRRLQRAVMGVVCAASMACSREEETMGPPPEQPLPEAKFQAITADLVTRSGAPGAIVGVVRGDQRWVGAAGSVDINGKLPMSADRVFRAASITKMFTASLVMREIEAGKIGLGDRLSTWQPPSPMPRTSPSINCSRTRRA